MNSNKPSIVPPCTDEKPSESGIQIQVAIINYGTVSNCFQGTTTIANFYEHSSDTDVPNPIESDTYEPLTVLRRSQSRHLKLKHLLNNTFSSPSKL